MKTSEQMPCAAFHAVKAAEEGTGRYLGLPVWLDRGMGVCRWSADAGTLASCAVGVDGRG
jgi:hypothetical protein